MTRRGWLVGALTLVLAGCSAGPVPPTRPSTACGSQDVRLVVPTEIYGAVNRLLDRAGCSTVTVDRLSGQDARKEPGDLWLADQWWTAGLPEVAVVATTPLVLVSRGKACGRTWHDIVTSPRFRPGNPAEDTAALMALTMGGRAGAVEPIARSLLQRIRRDPALARTVMVERVEDVASREFGPGGCTIVSEQAALQDGRTALVDLPSPATAWLSYRLVAPAGTPASADSIVEVLTGATAREALAESLLRGPDGAPLGHGVGDAGAPVGPSTHDLRAARTIWEDLAP